MYARLVCSSKSDSISAVSVPKPQVHVHSILPALQRWATRCKTTLDCTRPGLHVLLCVGIFAPTAGIGTVPEVDAMQDMGHMHLVQIL